MSRFGGTIFRQRGPVARKLEPFQGVGREEIFDDIAIPWLVNAIPCLVIAIPCLVIAIPCLVIAIP
jgi:hypothetical protein